MEKTSVLRPLDELSTEGFHLKVWVTSGMGFFTDAYDLWIISVALIFLTQVYHLTDAEQGMLTSASLFGAFLGPLLFGRLGDLFGRKYVYGLEMFILSLGAIGSALSPTYNILLLMRGIMGFGIGGDYPTSATVMAEYSGRRNRGQLTAMVFAMQGFGILAGIAVAFGLMSLSLKADLIWRLMLGFGAIPALSVIYLRRKIPETPRFDIAAGKVEEAANTVSQVTKKQVMVNSQQTTKIDMKRYIGLFMPYIVGVSIAWFLLDASYYGTGIFLPSLAGVLGFTGTLSKIEISALTFGLAAFPGYWVAVMLMDIEGRKAMQTIGFALMGFLFLVLGFVGKELEGTAFLFIYSLTFFFSNYGPNTTTFVYPTELFPTEFRSTGHGIAASSGKLGAAISTFIFPILLAEWGPYNLMIFLGSLALVGAAVTVVLLPETKGKSLEETSMENELILLQTSLVSLFDRLLEDIKNGAEVLQKESSGEIDAKEAIDEIRFWEHEGDDSVHEIFVSLNLRNISFMDHMDIAQLTEKLDDVLDAEQATAYRFMLYQAKPNDVTKQFAKGIVELSSLLRAGVDHLRDLVHGETKELEEIIRRIHEIENEADDLLRLALAEVFSQNDAITIIKYKDLYEHYELVSDLAEDVADVMADLAVKYSKQGWR
ncbi:MFS transporter [Tardisphaera saccharovorans]|nr:MFS transporter [TACK group archaeon]